MKIEFLKANKSQGIAKCTIHNNGKLGFSKAASDLLGLASFRFVKIGINAENRDDKNLFMIATNQEDESTFGVNKAGKYFYLNTKLLFDEMDIEYQKKKIMFDIVELSHEGQNIFKLIRRDKDRKSKK